MQDLLDKLKIPDKKKLLEFLVVYSRFEYALKRSNHLKSTTGNAEASGEKYISKIKGEFNPDKTADLRKAVDYLLKFPAQQQVIKDGKLDFEEHSSTKEGSIALRVFHCIRITRNNLFHGGKYTSKVVLELARNDRLIKDSILVLSEFINLDDLVYNYFWEIED